MFKTLACFFFVAVAASNAFIISDSTNDALNLYSTNSGIFQTGIQNVGVASVVPIGGKVSGLYRLPLYQYGLAGLGGAGSIISTSSNAASNIGSANSNIHQSNIQNVNQGGYNYYALI